MGRGPGLGQQRPGFWQLTLKAISHTLEAWSTSSKGVGESRGGGLPVSPRAPGAGICELLEGVAGPRHRRILQAPSRIHRLLPGLGAGSPIVLAQISFRMTSQHVVHTSVTLLLVFKRRQEETTLSWTWLMPRVLVGVWGKMAFLFVPESASKWLNA